LNGCRSRVPAVSELFTLIPSLLSRGDSEEF
jgi:hypothetical protein